MANECVGKKGDGTDSVHGLKRDVPLLSVKLSGWAARASLRRGGRERVGRRSERRNESGGEEKKGIKGRELEAG